MFRKTANPKAANKSNLISIHNIALILANVVLLGGNIFATTKHTKHRPQKNAIASGNNYQTASEKCSISTPLQTEDTTCTPTVPSDSLSTQESLPNTSPANNSWLLFGWESKLSNIALEKNFLNSDGTTPVTHGVLGSFIRHIFFPFFIIGGILYAFCNFVLYPIYYIIVEKVFRLNAQECLNDGILPSALWKKKSPYSFSIFVRRIIYILLPIVLCIIMCLIIITNDSYVKKDFFYSFQDDYANCYMLIYVFVFTYFVSGLFIRSFNARTDHYICELLSESTNSHKTVRKAFALLCFTFVFGILFFIPNRTAGITYWSDEIGWKSYVFYLALVCMSWYMTARLFILILINTIALYIASEKASSNSSPATSSLSLSHKLLKSLSASLGFGVFFLIAVGIILYSDFRAFRNFGMYLVTYKYSCIIICITIVISVFYYSTVILCYTSVSRRHKQWLTDSRSDMQHKSRSIMVSFFATLPVPIITAVVQHFVTLLVG